jgi:hypothetical protein
MTPLIHSITQHNHNYTSQSPMTCKANIGMMGDQGSSPGNNVTADYVSCRTERKRLHNSFSFYRGLILHRYRWSSTDTMVEQQCPETEYRCQGSWFPAVYHTIKGEASLTNSTVYLKMTT